MGLCGNMNGCLGVSPVLLILWMGGNTKECLKGIDSFFVYYAIC